MGQLIWFFNSAWILYAMKTWFHNVISLTFRKLYKNKNRNNTFMMFNIKNTNVTFFCFIEDSKQVFALMLTYHKSLFILNICSFYQQKKRAILPFSAETEYFNAIVPTTSDRFPFRTSKCHCILCQTWLWSVCEWWVCVPFFLIANRHSPFKSPSHPVTHQSYLTDWHFEEPYRLVKWQDSNPHARCTQTGTRASLTQERE